jgi:hypothetical protein
LLDAEFEYDLDKDPVSRGVVVTPMTRVDRQIVRMAEFKGWYELKTAQTGASDYDNLQVLAGTFNGAVVQENKQSVIMNSAGTPIVPPVEKDVGSQIWAVEWLKESGVNYDDYIGRSNSSSFTIVSATQNIDTTFAAGQLTVLAASQTPTWIYNRHLFLTRIELEIVPSGSYGDIFELDQGLAEKLYLGDDDGKGGEVDSVSLPRHKLRVIEDGGKPISHPVPFDGAGKLIPNFEPKDLVYLRWRTAPPFNFSALQIGDYD